MNIDHTVNMESSHLEPDKELSLKPKNIQASTEQPKNSEAATEQPQNFEAPRDQVVAGYRCGMASMLPFHRKPPADGMKLCYICGDDDGSHEELQCPFNYMYMSEDTSGICEGSCSGGKHAMAAVISGSGSGRRREFLRCFVRVNNFPTKLPAWLLSWLCQPFGPLRMYHLVMRSGKFSRGFGYAIFSSRQHAERAIESLNGRIFHGRKLRVDWVYPCI